MTVDEYIVLYHRKKRWLDKFSALALSVSGPLQKITGQNIQSVYQVNIRAVKIRRIWNRVYYEFVQFTLAKDDEGKYLGPQAFTSPIKLPNAENRNDTASVHPGKEAGS